MLTQEQSLARFLAFAVHQLGGSLKISKAALDNMLPTRLVWDTTSEPDMVTVAVISNQVIQLVVEKDEPVDMDKIKSPEHEVAPPPESDPGIQEETQPHPPVDEDED